MIIVFGVCLAFLFAVAAYTTAVSYCWVSNKLAGWEAWTYPAALWAVVAVAGHALAEAWRLS